MSSWKFCLAQDYQYSTGFTFDQELEFRDKQGHRRMKISETGIITIFKYYAWDGCSPKVRVFDLGYIGTPDGILDNKTGLPKTYFASLIHDALYQFIEDSNMPFSRKDMDTLFLNLMASTRFQFRYVYYYFVRFFGKLFYRIGKAIQY